MMQSVDSFSSQRTAIKDIFGWLALGCVVGGIIVYVYADEYCSKEILDLQDTNNQKRRSIEQTRQNINNVPDVEASKKRRNEMQRAENEQLGAEVNHGRKSYEQIQNERYRRRCAIVGLSLDNERLCREWDEYLISQEHNARQGLDEGKRDTVVSAVQAKKQAKKDGCAIC